MDFLKSSFTILGIGRSGIAVAKLLKRNGVSSNRIFLSDGSRKEDLSYLNEEELKNEGFEFETGGHSDKALESDVIIKSPGISPSSEIIQKARSKGIKVYSEVEVAFRFCKGKIIGITGTNGKTTTTSLIGEIFKNTGIETYVCGNVGLAFSEIADKASDKSVVVLELSSYQLFDIEEFKPAVSVILNITEDHLEWHGSFKDYLKSKLKIYENQNKNDLMVFNYDDEILLENVKAYNTKTAAFSIKENPENKNFTEGAFVEDGLIKYFNTQEKLTEEIMTTKELNLRGNHNLYNSLAAVISAKAFGIKSELIKNTLMNFSGVEHRIEFVKEINGVKYFNDSKATNLDSLVVALQSFEEDVILILGGRESGNQYEKVESLIRNKVKQIFAIGETKEKIYNFFKGKIKVEKAGTLEEAVIKSNLTAKSGDVVLFSPACKSFDMFRNFEERGKEFKRNVVSLN